VALFSAPRPVTSAEDLFLDRYPSLLRYALSLTRQDRPEAEDLVHDAFVRFTLVRPVLRQPDKLDVYLHAMLRNLHMSRVRRRTRRDEVALGLLEYDSLAIALDAVDPRRWLEARDQLRAACHYGCLRKASSKAGTVFLLRFFLGYLPDEIARLLRSPTARVDEFIFWARRELKTYLNEPEKLSFIGDPDSTAHPLRPDPPSGVDDPATFFGELRTAVFAAPHAACFSAGALAAMYAPSAARKPLETATAAELVGCHDCLDRARALLALPSDSDRDPIDRARPGALGGDPKLPPPRSDRLAKGLRRVREVLFHRPRELRIVVNGFELARERLTGTASELTLSVSVAEPVRLVELLSEQDLCLAFLDVCPPPDGEMEQDVHVELADGRSVDLRVSFEGSSPSVRARYHDAAPLRATLATDALGEASAEPPDEDRIREAYPRSGPWRVFDWAPSLRRRLAWGLSLAVAAWLLFFTPGTQVSAAERLVQAVSRLVERILQRQDETSGGATRPERPAIPTATPPLAQPRPLVPPARKPLDERAAVELELAALVRLRGADAYLGQEVSLGRASQGWVRVEAAVSTRERRVELLRALGPLRGAHGLDVKVRALTDVPTPGPRTPFPGSVHVYDLVADRFPAFEAVRDHLLSRDAMAASVDDHVRSFASEVFLGSRQASQHAWSLRHLAARYSPAKVDQLTPAARRDWRELLRVHAQSFLTQQREIEARLRPVFSPADDLEVSSPADSDDVWTLSDRLLALDVRREAAIAAAFTVSEDAGAVGAARGAQFWQELREAALCAQAIERVSSEVR
jgi:DNA-directed RNA polymerase specialized sigma24 family protein